MQARRWRRRGQSPHRRGSEPTVRGWNSRLSWRGFLVALPFHWHCPRRGQGRQLRMLAAYTTRRLPLSSQRRSCARSVCPAGQRKVPSGWRAKSRPEKRSAFQGWATSGGPYPQRGALRSESWGSAGANERRHAAQSGRGDGPVPASGSRPIAPPIASTPVHKGSGCTNDLGRSPDPRLQAEAQKRRDASTARRHRRR
jgi:hypothetical protein